MMRLPPAEACLRTLPIPPPPANSNSPPPVSAFREKECHPARCSSRISEVVPAHLSRRTWVRHPSHNKRFLQWEARLLSQRQKLVSSAKERPPCRRENDRGTQAY